MRAHRLPLVVMNDGIAAADVAIMTDNRAGMRLLMEHLHALGHRSVGTIAGTEGHNEADIRLDAFYRSAAHLGMHAPEDFVTRAQAFSIAEGERAMSELRPLLPAVGSYVSESDFFQPAWQQAFWGRNYERLLAVKRKYDPDGLFFVHHGVGSEDWSADGFTPLAR